jgi:uncharacterized OsmC-like protein
MRAPSEAEYGRVLAAAERVDWRIEDVLPEGTRFDFARPFLPEELTGAGALGFLDAGEQLALGHVRAAGYLGIFGIVEEMILPFVVAHTKTAALGDLTPVRALLRFAAEEAKHIELFRRFRATFDRDFGGACGLIGPADAFAQAVLAHPPLAVALAILHIEWMTQRHWLDAVHGDEGLEPAFKRLLRYHWMEEAQHARLDGLLARELAAGLAPAEIEAAVDGYLAIVALLDGALGQQVELDLEGLARRTGRTLGAGEARRFRVAQRASMRRVYLISGMTHPQLVAALEAIAPGAAGRVAAAAAALTDDNNDNDKEIAMETSTMTAAPAPASAQAPADGNVAPTMLNGFDLAVLGAAIAGVAAADAASATVAFRATTSWQGRLASRTSIESYTLGGVEIPRRHEIACDEPVEILGGDAAPNPQDLLLAALNACMTVGLVAAATGKGVAIESLSIESELALDLRGAFGVAPGVIPGADRIRYTIRVKGSGTKEQWDEIHREMAANSPNRFHLATPIPLEAQIVVE